MPDDTNPTENVTTTPTEPATETEPTALPSQVRRRLLLLRRLIATALQLGDAADPLLRILAGLPVTLPVTVGDVTNFSPLEQAIIDAIEMASEPLQGKQVAAKTGKPYDARLKALLRNLCARGVLVHVPGQGYALARVEVTP